MNVIFLTLFLRANYVFLFVFLILAAANSLIAFITNSNQRLDDVLIQLFCSALLIIMSIITRRQLNKEIRENEQSAARAKSGQVISNIPALMVAVISGFAIWVCLKLLKKSEKRLNEEATQRD